MPGAVPPTLATLAMAPAAADVLTKVWPIPDINGLMMAANGLDCPGSGVTTQRPSMMVVRSVVFIARGVAVFVWMLVTIDARHESPPGFYTETSWIARCLGQRSHFLRTRRAHCAWWASLPH